MTPYTETNQHNRNRYTGDSREREQINLSPNKVTALTMTIKIPHQRILKTFNTGFVKQKKSNFKKYVFYIFHTLTVKIKYNNLMRSEYKKITIKHEMC